MDKGITFVNFWRAEDGTGGFGGSIGGHVGSFEGDVERGPELRSFVKINFGNLFAHRFGLVAFA